MENNTISLIADLESGDELPYLRDATPTEAIQRFIANNETLPIQQLVITAKTNDGRTVSIALTHHQIMATII
ncbi:MAG: hypothetical protein ABIO46_08075 [Chitinophagales bacterium]